MLEYSRDINSLLDDQRSTTLSPLIEDPKVVLKVNMSLLM